MAQGRRTVVVTGSSSGIGRAIAVRLLESGYNVVLNYSVDDAKAAAALSSCREIDAAVILVKADVSKPEQVHRLVDNAVTEFGSLDVLVNNAARVVDRPALEMTEDEWDAVVDVNLKGAFLCAQYAARQMLKQDSGGVILNIGASTGIRGRRNGVNTCASKAGLMILTQCLALELGPRIRVNTIIPGLTVTDETRRRFGLDEPSIRQARGEQIPLHRLGQPEDIAKVAALMLSEDAGFINRQKVVVDGGQYMW